MVWIFELMLLFRTSLLVCVTQCLWYWSLARIFSTPNIHKDKQNPTNSSPKIGFNFSKVSLKGIQLFHYKSTRVILSSTPKIGCSDLPRVIVFWRTILFNSFVVVYKLHHFVMPMATFYNFQHLNHYEFIIWIIFFHSHMGKYRCCTSPNFCDLKSSWNGTFLWNYQLIHENWIANYAAMGSLPLSFHKPRLRLSAAQKIIKYIFECHIVMENPEETLML